MKISLIFILLLNLFPITIYTQFEDEEEGDSISYKRNFWFLKQRGAPYDTISPDALYDAMNEKSTLGPQGYYLSNSWYNIGPSPGSYGTGRVSTVRFCGSNKLYIGAANGGVWKAENFYPNWYSLNWSNCSNGLKSLSSGAIAIDNNYEPPHIYYGSGEGIYGFVYGYLGQGLFISTDGGNSWIQRYKNTGLDNVSKFFKIVIKPGYSNNELLAATDKGLFRTTDFGLNWSVITGTENLICTDVEFSEVNNDIVFAIGPSKTLPRYDIRGIGFLKSTDGGIPFQSITL